MKIKNLFRKPQNKWVWYQGKDDQKLKMGDELSYIFINNDKMCKTFKANSMPIKIINVTGDIVEIKLDISNYAVVSMEDIMDYKLIIKRD